MLTSRRTGSGANSGWRWDVSAHYGDNRVSLDTIHTVNDAFLNDFGDTPTRFFDGIASSAQQAMEVDIAKDLSPDWLPNPLTLAFGAEYLRETYRISAGDPDTYYIGTSGVRGGAQGFSGYSPVNAGARIRSDVAQYVSLQTHLTDQPGTSIAVRHEDYNDFGNTVSGALWVRDDFNLADWTFTVGVDNASNSYPDKVIAANNHHDILPYSEFSPDGFNERYYYTKVIYHW